jgi:predicted nucleotidyltransferase
MTTVAQDPISPIIRADIMARLRAAEIEHGVKVLLAVESGSRAWGFESPNSDYDARFIYVHPKDWYVSVGLEEQRDVIEYPIVDDIDINGWDLRKALRLFAKSNPAFVEWIQSPIIYSETGPFAAQARALLPSHYACDSGFHHYLSMAKSNYREYLQGDIVKIKKYFYVLRPLLAVRWLHRYGYAPPIEFDKLLHLIEDQPAVLAAVHELLIKKRAAQELGLEPAVPAINAFIEQELARLPDNAPRKVHRESVIPALNQVFHAALDVAWV